MFAAGLSNGGTTTSFIVSYPEEFTIPEDAKNVLAELVWDTRIPQDLDLVVNGATFNRNDNGTLLAPDSPARLWLHAPEPGEWRAEGKPKTVAVAAIYDVYVTLFYDEPPPDFTAVPQ